MRSKEKSTHEVQIFMDVHSDLRSYSRSILFTTMNQGFSFMTCYSRQELSFKIFLQPFKIEVWIALMLTMVSIGGFLVVSLTRKLQWGFLEAISLAQFAVISIALERPTYPGKKLMRMTVFKILLGVWLMLAPIMTYGYLGISINSISSQLESISVT